VAARRRNFPTRENLARKEAELLKDGKAGKMAESELSQLEVKLRKKLCIMDYDPAEERRLNRTKRGLLKRINSGKRYRTGALRKTEADDDDVSEERKPEESKATEGPSKEERERSRHQMRNEMKGLSKAKRIKLKAKQKEDKANEQTKEKTNEEIIDELKKEAGDLPASEPVVEAKKPPKSHSAMDIINHLKSRKQEDQALVDNFLSEKPSSDKFRYHQNNLLSNLMLEDVFKERNIMLQALRHIVSNNFLQDNPTPQ
jgi:hypothetical protein